MKQVFKFTKYVVKLKNYQQVTVTLLDSQFMKLMVGVSYNSFIND